MPVALSEAARFGVVDKNETIKVKHEGMKYPEYAPVNDSTEVIPDIESFDYHDRACDADPAMPVFYNDHVNIEEVRRFDGCKG
jgi:hypothetical protein